MEEIVYYASNATDLYAFVLDGGDNKLVANGFKNIVDLYSFQGNIFVVDSQLGLYSIRLENGKYSEQLILNATGIQAVAVYQNSEAAFLGKVWAVLVLAAVSVYLY